MAQASKGSIDKASFVRFLISNGSRNPLPTSDTPDTCLSLITAKVSIVNTIQSLASYLRKSTLETSKDLLDARVLRDPETANAVGVLLQDLDSLGDILEKEEVDLRNAEVIGEVEVEDGRGGSWSPVTVKGD